MGHASTAPEPPHKNAGQHHSGYAPHRLVQLWRLTGERNHDPSLSDCGKRNPSLSDYCKRNPSLSDCCERNPSLDCGERNPSLSDCGERNPSLDCGKRNPSLSTGPGDSDDCHAALLSPSVSERGL